MKQERESLGPMYNEDGDVIISEEEFLEINKLKSLKGTALRLSLVRPSPLPKISSDMLCFTMAA